MKPTFGMSDKERKEVAEHLNDLLADTYALLVKTQNFHWNVTGPEFFQLHLLFDKHYEEMAVGVDEIAERIRTLGFFVEAAFSSFKKRTGISEEHKKIPAKDMIERLVLGHELIAKKYRPLIHEAQKLHDEMTGDLAIKRISFHEKASWFLRSHLEK